MRISRLDLHAFGPFADVSLDLSGGSAGLHLLCGPNEAGKSSLLRSIRHLLFGIRLPTKSDPRPDAAFLHPRGDLRLGAVLQHSNGEQLEFLRKYGRKGTLLKPDGRTRLPDDQLESWLGRVGRDFFETMFGLGHAELEHGGEAILQGQGELGQLLFLAGSGLADLRRVREQLKTEMDQLFTPTARTRQINESLINLKKLRGEIRNAMLSSDAFAELMQKLQTAKNELLEVESQQADLTRRTQRLQRIRRALPHITRRRELQQQLASAGDVPRLPAEFSQQRQNLQQRLELINHEVRLLESNLEERLAALNDIDVPHALLEQADVIDQLATYRGAVLKAISDRRDRAGELKGFEQQATAALHGLRPDLTLDEAGQLRLTRQSQQGIRQTGSQLDQLRVQLQERRDTLSALEGSLESLQAEAARAPSIPDCTALQTLLPLAHSLVLQEQELGDSRRELSELRDQVAIELQQLPLWSGTLDDLEQTPLPATETIERFLDELDSAAARLETAEQRLEETTELHNGKTLRLEELQRRGDVPTEDDLQAARQRRDAGWQLVIAVRDARLTPDSAEVSEWLGSSDSPAPSSLDDAYVDAVEQADLIADRLRREAAQVAAKATLVAEIDNLQQLLDRRGEQCAEARSAQDATTTEWNDAWHEAGVTPGSPREMRSWLTRCMELRRRAGELRTRASRIDEVTRRIEEVRGPLLQALQESADDGAAGDATLSAVPLAGLIERAETSIARAEEARQEQSARRKEIHRLEQQLQEGRRERQDVEQSLKEVESAWEASMEELGLPATSTTTQFSSWLDDVNVLLSQLQKIESHRQRIDDIDTDQAKFAERIKDCTRDFAPDLAGREPVDGAAVLRQRLEAARAEQGRQTELEQAIAQLRRQLDERSSELAEVESRLNEMCRQAGCGEISELPRVEEQSRQQRLLETTVDEVEELLIRESPTTTPEEFVTDAATEDVETLDPRLKQLEQDAEALRQHRDQLRDSIRELEMAREQMDGNAKASELTDREQAVLAGLEQAVPQWVRCHLASLLLQQAMERFREQNQTPVLRRTTEVFRGLTGNTWAELRPDFDDSGEPVLKAVRAADGKLVPLAGLSDGTRDQLYLALRIAGLENWLDRHEPLPFIVDDVLINFDDDRSAAALELLGELSRRTQVIYLTHHRHTRELARAAVAEEDLFCYELPHSAFEAGTRIAAGS